MRKLLCSISLLHFEQDDLKLAVRGVPQSAGCSLFKTSDDGDDDGDDHKSLELALRFKLELYISVNMKKEKLKTVLFVLLLHSY